MTNEQFLEQFENLLPKVMDGLRKRAVQAVESGLLNIADDPPHYYRSIKPVLCAALRREVLQWRFHGAASNEANIMQFMD